MTMRAVIRVPHFWRSQASYALAGIAETCGLSIGQDEGRSKAIGYLVYARPGQSIVLPNRVEGNFLVRIPFLGPEAPSPLWQEGWEPRSCLWEGEDTLLHVRSPVIPLPAGRVLARWTDDLRPSVVLHESKGLAVVEFSFDAIASFFTTISQLDEDSIRARDAHLRVPQEMTFPIVKNVSLNPIATDSALLVGKAIKAACGVTGTFLVVKAPWPVEVTGIACVTHDVDSIRKWTVRRALSKITRTFEATKRHNVSSPSKTMWAIIAEMAVRDPHQNLGDIRRLEMHHGIRATYFLQMAKRGGHRDPRNLYSYRSRYLQRETRRLSAEGHELALHSTYESADEPSRLREEARRLSDMNVPAGARQHYLRIHRGLWREQESCGLLYDSSVGYSDFVGFRSGACHPYHPYNPETGQGFSLLEIPFAMMDSGIYQSCRGKRAEMEQSLTTLADIVSRRQGVLVSIWHNQYLDGALVSRESLLEWWVASLKAKGWQFWTMQRVARWWENRHRTEVLCHDPDTWGVVPHGDVEQFLLQCYGGRVGSVDGVARDAWSVKETNGFSILAIRGLRALSSVTVRREAPA